LITGQQHGAPPANPDHDAQAALELEAAAVSDLRIHTLRVLLGLRLTDPHYWLYAANAAIRRRRAQETRFLDFEIAGSVWDLGVLLGALIAGPEIGSDTRAGAWYLITRLYDVTDSALSKLLYSIGCLICGYVTFLSRSPRT
jgi:hypothetical protein